MHLPIQAFVAGGNDSDAARFSVFPGLRNIGSDMEVSDDVEKSRC
jgi:hypothetical protein